MVLTRVCPEHKLELDWHEGGCGGGEEIASCQACGRCRSWRIADLESGIYSEVIEQNPDWLREAQPWERLVKISRKKTDSGSDNEAYSIERNQALLEELEWWDCL